MIAAVAPGGRRVSARRPVNPVAPEQVVALEADYKRLFCPHCRSFLLEACFEGAAAVRIKCRQCTRRAAKPVMVVIEIEIQLAAAAPTIVDSAVSEPIERDSTPPS
ncbi:MAG: hypothetical protein E6Q97_12245 [Desulfurellales bacterium]|nr:MAG: hypothetical protein E6Q97_12245 [Desulfurellales bacterium]